MPDQGEPEKPKARRTARRGQGSKPDPVLNVASLNDLNKLLKAVKDLHTPHESQEDIDSRTRIAESKNTHRQRVELIVLTIVATVLLSCIALMLMTSSDALKDKCLTAIVGIVSGVVGALLGKAIGKD